MNKTIIYYGLSDEEEAILKKTAPGCELIEPAEEDIQEKIGYIAGLPGFEREEPEPVELPEDPQILIFSFSDKKDLYNIIADMKKEGYSFPYKAILTETNRDWQFSYMLSHIQKEHAIVEAYHKLGVLVKKVQDSPEKYPAKDLDKDIQRARDLPKLGEDLTVELIDDLRGEMEEKFSENK